eukprot:s106_g5.t1
MSRLPSALERLGSANSVTKCGASAVGGRGTAGDPILYGPTYNSAWPGSRANTAVDGPAFPVVIPVGRAGSIEEATVPSNAANDSGSSGGPAGPEAEAAMWKALGDVVTTRLKLAADTLSKGPVSAPAPPFTSSSALPPVGPGLGMGALPPVPVSGAGPGPWGALPPMPPVVAPASTLSCALWASQYAVPAQRRPSQKALGRFL